MNKNKIKDCMKLFKTWLIQLFFAVLFEPDESAVRSHKESGNKANEHKPKIDYCGEFIYIFAGISVTERPHKRKQQRIQKTVSRCKTSKQRHYTIQVFADGRRENAIICNFQKFKDAAHCFSSPEFIDTITQKGEMSNVFCS